MAGISKVTGAGIIDSVNADIATGVAKVGITPTQASNITTNNAKVTNSDQTQSDVNALGVTATSVDLGNWTITEAGGVLKFTTGSTDSAKLDASGNLTVIGNITAYGSI